MQFSDRGVFIVIMIFKIHKNHYNRIKLLTENEHGEMSKPFLSTKSIVTKFELKLVLYFLFVKNFYLGVYMDTYIKLYY